MVSRLRNKIAYLQEIEIFQDLTERELEDMNQSLTLTTTPAGRIFYSPEEHGEVLFILKRGRVQCYRISPEGKKLVLDTLGSGAVFGEMSMIGQGMHNAFAEAVEDSTICVMSRTDLERLLRTKPQVAFRLIEAMGDRIVELEARLEDIAFKSVPARLASLLLRLQKDRGRRILGLTHQDLADTVGTYRETTTQTLNRFKAQGLIATGRKRIEILDSGGLMQVAES